MDKNKATSVDFQEINQSIRLYCNDTAGSLSTRFLCASISLLDPSEPVTVPESATVKEVMKFLQGNRIGCVVVVTEEGQLSGIFSERDYVLKVFDHQNAESKPISEFMTPEPVTISLDETIAYGLTLMSQGGFRHLPIIDQQALPVGILSVKDFVDYLSQQMMQDVMDIELEV